MYIYTNTVYIPIYINVCAYTHVNRHIKYAYICMGLYVVCTYIYVSVKPLCRPWGRASSGETSCPLSICPCPTVLSTAVDMTSRTQHI